MGGECKRTATKSEMWYGDEGKPYNVYAALAGSVIGAALFKRFAD